MASKVVRFGVKRHTAVTMNSLCAFRSALYTCFSKRADALFELTDALITGGPQPSPVRLSLQPRHAPNFPASLDVERQLSALLLVHPLRLLERAELRRHLHIGPFEQAGHHFAGRRDAWATPPTGTASFLCCKPALWGTLWFPGRPQAWSSQRTLTLGSRRIPKNVFMTLGALMMAVRFRPAPSSTTMR